MQGWNGLNQQESTEFVDNVLIACNQACRTIELLLLDMDSLDFKVFNLSMGFIFKLAHIFFFFCTIISCDVYR